MHVAGVLGALDAWLSFALGGVVDLRALTNAPLSVQLHPAPPFFGYVGTIAVRWLHGDRSRSGWRCARIARRGDGGGGRVDGGDRWQLSAFEYEPPRELPPPEPPPILPPPEPPPERRAVSVTSALAGSASVRGVDPRSRCTNGTALAQLHRHWSTCANVGYGAMGLFGYGARTPLEWRHVDWSGSRATRVGTVVERTAASLTCWERTVSFSTTRSRLHRTRPFTATWIGDHAALSVSSLRVLAVAPRRGELLLDGECAREAGCSVSDSGSSSTPPACACRTVQEVPGAPSRCGTSIARANNVGGRCSGSSAVARSSASDATQCRWVHGAAAARG